MSMSFRSCPRCGGEVRADDPTCSHCGAHIARAPDEDTPPAAHEKRSAWSELGERLQEATGDRYRVDRLLGYGGMAGVFLADDLRLDRRVAIKVMSPGLMMDHGLVDRFEREAKTIAKLEHPNIVTIYEVGRGEGLHFFTMTYVPGRALGTVMAEREGGFPIPVVRAVLSQVAEALAYAHRSGVVHRDVKPGNILLDEDGAAVVTDFGIAKVADTPSLTRTGMLVGTPSYMSPEQCGGTEVGGPSDQYSLGAVAYQMLTGAPPFRGPTATVLHAHLHDPPPSLKERRPDCPSDLAATVTRMLAKKPHERWTDMAAVARAVDAPALRTDDPVREQLRELATPAASVSVAPSSVALSPGRKQRLEASVLRADGRRLSGRSVAWRSSDPRVAVVTRNGVVGAVGSGRATVRASTGGVSAEVEVAVSEAASGVARLEVRPEAVELAPGESAALSATAVLDDGSRMEEAAVAWSSDDPGVAKVGASGRVRGVQVGSARITAELAGAGGSARVRVAEAPATVGAPGAVGAGDETRAGRSAAGPLRGGRALVAGGIAVAVLAAVALAVWQPWSGDVADAGAEDPGSPVAGSTEGGGGSGDEAPVASPEPDGSPGPEDADDGDGGEPEVASAGEVASPVGAEPGSGGGTSGPAPEEPGSGEPGEPEEPAGGGAPDAGVVRLAGAVPDAARAVARPLEGGAVRAFLGDSLRLPPGRYELELVGSVDGLLRDTVEVRAGEAVEWSVPAPVTADAGPAADGDAGPPAGDAAGNGAADGDDPAAGDAAAGGDGAEPAEEAAAAAVEAERAREEARAAVRDFVDAFGARRAEEVVPLLPEPARDGWRALLGSDDVDDFTARLADLGEPRVDLDAGTAVVAFSVDLSYRNLNRSAGQRLSLEGALERSGDEWGLTAVSIVP